MATLKTPPPTYHVVPRFDIAAKGGALQLGIIVDSLLKLRPLNRQEVVPITDDLRYPPVVQLGFTDSKRRLLEGHAGIWAKFLVYAGVSAATQRENAIETTVSCDSIITEYFDPDEAYVSRSLACRGVNDYFIASGYEDDVYMITGLKVAKGLRYGSTKSTLRGANREISSGISEVGAEVGVGAGFSSQRQFTTQFEANDIIVGYRVRRYAYVPASSRPFSKKKTLRHEDYLTGAEMYDDAGGNEFRVYDSTYQQVSIPEEQEAQEKIHSLDDFGDIWVAPRQ